MSRSAASIAHGQKNGALDSSMLHAASKDANPLGTRDRSAVGARSRSGRLAEIPIGREATALGVLGASRVGQEASW